MKIVKSLLLVLFSSLFMVNGFGQTKPPAAQQVIKNAKAEAAKTNRNILVIFHASWCIWCHRMDTAMNDEPIQSFFDKSYVIRHLTVNESKGKKALENPGAAGLLKNYHGDQQGIPYWCILDQRGKLLADSRWHSDEGGATGNNVGCPAQPDEVAYFIKVLKKTSHLTDKKLEMIRERFLKIGH